VSTPDPAGDPLSRLELTRLEFTVVPRAVVRDLQWRVLRGGPRPADDSSLGSDAPSSFSVAAHSGGAAVIGAATFFREHASFDGLPNVDPTTHWRLRGMATAPEAQGRGVGALVLDRGLAEVEVRGGRLVWCNARVAALPFYVRQGFSLVGDVFLTAESGIPHRRAWRLVGPPGPAPGDA
jgi:GNAT superfamily N-acetyltransferase